MNLRSEEGEAGGCLAIIVVLTIIVMGIANGDWMAFWIFGGLYVAYLIADAINGG